MSKKVYPIITKDNFNQIAKKLLIRKSVLTDSHGWGLRKEGYWALRVKAPRTRNEFYQFTKNMFGEGMEIIGYEDRPGIKHSENYSDKNPIFKLWRGLSIDGYRLIGHTAFGNMGTGGWDYGGYDYGFGHRERKRLHLLFNSKLTIRLPKSSNQTN